MQAISASLLLSSSTDPQIDTAEKTWLEEADLLTDPEKQMLAKLQIRRKVEELKKEKGRLESLGFSAQKIASDLDLLIEIFHQSRHQTQEVKKTSLSRRAIEIQKRESLGDQFQKSALSFQVYHKQLSEPVKKTETIPEYEARQNTLETLALFHVAGQAVHLTGATVGAGIQAVCNFNPTTKKICDKTGFFAKKSAKTVLETTGTKEPVKKTIHWLSSFDGSTIANGLVNAYGFPQDEAQQMSEQLLSDVGNSARLAGTVGTVYAACKVLKYSGAASKALAKSETVSKAAKAARRSFSYLKETKQLLDFRSVIDGLSQGASFLKLLQGPALAYATIPIRNRAALFSQRHPSDFPTSFFSLKHQGQKAKPASRTPKEAFKEEKAIRNRPWPEIQSVPADFPKNFNEFCHKAQVYEGKTKGVKASIFHAPSKGAGTLYLLAKNNPGYNVGPKRHDVKFWNKSTTSLEKTNSFLDIVFARSRAENHSYAFLIFHDAEFFGLPIMQALENRAERIVGKSTFPKGKLDRPMIMLKIELPPKL